MSDSTHPFADLFAVTNARLTDMSVEDMAEFLDLTATAVIGSEITKELFTRRIDINQFSQVRTSVLPPQYRAFWVLDPSYLKGYVVWLASKTDGKHWIVSHVLDNLGVDEMTNLELAQFLARNGFNLTEALMVINSMIGLEMSRRAAEYRARSENLEKFHASIMSVTDTVRFIAQRPQLMQSFQQGEA